MGWQQTGAIFNKAIIKFLYIKVFTLTQILLSPPKSEHSISRSRGQLSAKSGHSAKESLIESISWTTFQVAGHLLFLSSEINSPLILPNEALSVLSIQPCNFRSL